MFKILRLLYLPEELEINLCARSITQATNHFSDLQKIYSIFHLDSSVLQSDLEIIIIIKNLTEYFPYTAGLPSDIHCI